MNKRELKIIDGISKQLPEIQFVASYDKSKISGEDLLLAGYTNDKSIDPAKYYFIDVPTIRTVDHKLRLKRIYRSRGKKGIITYCKKYVQPEKLGIFQHTIMTNFIK